MIFAVKNLNIFFVKQTENIVPKRAIKKAQQEARGHRIEERRFVNGVVKSLLVRLLTLKPKVIIFVLILALLIGGLNMDFMEKITRTGWAVIAKKFIKMVGVELKKKFVFVPIMFVKFVVKNTN